MYKLAAETLTDMPFRDSKWTTLYDKTNTNQHYGILSGEKRMIRQHSAHVTFTHLTPARVTPQTTEKRKETIALADVYKISVGPSHQLQGNQETLSSLKSAWVTYFNHRISA